LRVTQIGVRAYTPTTVAAQTAATPTHTPAIVATPTAATPTPTTIATPTPVISTSWPITQVLGESTLGWPIEAYQFGNGPIRLAFIGGIHGGYEWNTILLAFEAIDHFTAHRDSIPASVTIYIVPSANPDGQVRVLNHAGRFTADEVPTETVPGRFNGNDVDLNRNWDQSWTPVGIWGTREVSAGDAPFSEIETQILRDFLSSMHSVVFWHSARPGVYVAFCHDPYPPSQALAAIYAKAAQYPLYAGFYDYAVTGNATDWLACEGIPAIAVELTNHRATDAKQNLAAIQAAINEYSSSIGQ
jgi:predicted deacylase